MPDSIIETLAQYIANDILKQPGRALPAETKIISSGLVDSFSLVDLSMFIEERFGVTIDDTELNAQTFDTIAELAELVESRK